jgi:rare lipoprotein A
LRRTGVSAGVLSIAMTGAGTAVAQTDTPNPRPLRVSFERMHVRAGGDAVVRGRAMPGQTVRLKVRQDGHWTTLRAGRAKRNGWFAVHAHPHRSMSVPARVTAGGRSRRLGRLNVYRYAEASWYGPGLYGNHLACGGTLTPGTLGVANKYLPCGARVTLRNAGHVVRVKVVDRGPYSGNREFDLTAATARRLHFSGAHAVLTTR